MDIQDIERLAKQELREEADKAAVAAAKERLRKHREARSDWWAEARNGFQIGLLLGVLLVIAAATVMVLAVIIFTPTHH